MTGKMKENTVVKDRTRRLDERGVALPLALFGMVAVSLLVTSALMTSSTELALSKAHQEGTQALFGADAALESFVAQRAAMTSDTHLRFVSGGYPITANNENYAIAIAELFRSDAVPDGSGGFERAETYSVIAEPTDNMGRGVGALVEVTRMASAISLNIDSGLTLGTDATVAGSATISDGSSAGAACDSASAPAAIRHADSTTVTEQGNGHDIYGSIVEDSLDAAALADYVLNGQSIDDLTNLSHIRFGPMFGEPSFAGSPTQYATDPKYQWGCPAQMVTGCGAAESGYFPTVVIDANGGVVDITGDHGQGILVIRNGEVHIRGNFRYAGIIIAEGVLTITGTPQVEGAVLALGDEAVIDPDDDVGASGNSLIRFNKCEIVEAQKGLTINSLNMTEQTIDNPTFAWFEVIR